MPHNVPTREEAASAVDSNHPRLPLSKQQALCDCQAGGGHLLDVGMLYIPIGVGML